MEITHRISHPNSRWWGDAFKIPPTKGIRWVKITTGNPWVKYLEVKREDSIPFLHINCVFLLLRQHCIPKEMFLLSFPIDHYLCLYMSCISIWQYFTETVPWGSHRHHKVWTIGKIKYKAKKVYLLLTFRSKQEIEGIKSLSVYFWALWYISSKTKEPQTKY